MAQRMFTIENNIIKGEEYSIPIQSDCIGNLFLKVFDEKPNYVSQIEVETGKQTTYAEMKKTSIQCAMWLQKQGVKSTDIVVVCTPNQPMDYVPVVATLLIGAIYNPWYHEVTLKTARHLMNLIRPKIIFSCASTANLLRDAAQLEGVNVDHIVVFENQKRFPQLGDILEENNKSIETFKAVDSRLEDEVAMIVFSSGSTGLPKGVSYSCKVIKNLLNGAVAFPPNYTNILWYSPLYWLSGTLHLFLTTLGFTKRILHLSFDPEETCRVINEFKVEYLFIPPTLVTHLCKSRVLEKYELNSLKFIFTGGAKLGKKFIKQIKSHLPNVYFRQLYGLTESCATLTITTNSCTRENSVGFIVSNSQIKIIDLESGQALGPNESGEICFKTAKAMLGYYRNPKATQEMIDNEGWYHTGDIGYYMENGEIMIVDKKKEMMKYRGHQISPSEIEEYLMTHKAVLEAAVIGVPHDLEIEVPMAFIKKNPGYEVSEEELVDFSAELDVLKKLRGGVKFLDELPHTPSGKIDKKLLKDLAAAPLK